MSRRYNVNGMDHYNPKRFFLCRTNAFKILGTLKLDNIVPRALSFSNKYIFYQDFYAYGIKKSRRG